MLTVPRKLVQKELLETNEPANAPEASNPFSGVFKVANGQIYPIEHVHIQAVGRIL
jgi:hypothetical protein